MSANQTSRSLMLLLLGLLGLAAGLFFVTQQGSGRETVNPLGPGERSITGRLPGEPEAALLIPEPTLDSRPERAGPSTVLWPLKVELGLIAADFLPSEDGVVNVGSGASASLKGRIEDKRNMGVRAQIRFVAGSNEGRILQANKNGDFGASDLYPGLAIVEVSGPGIVGSRREVRLRQRSEELLNIGYARPATVVGWVQDTQGQPILGASVRVDGIPLNCDLDGAFSATNVASGTNVLLEIEHPEYVTLQSTVRLAANQRTMEDQWRFTLRKGSELRLVVTNDIGGPEPVEVYLLPGKQQRSIPAGLGYRKERFPFHSINPIKVKPGKPVLVRGLPSGSLAVYAFRMGARAKMGFTNLRSDRESVHKMRFSTADQITGTLTLDGKPVPDLDVSLEAPNRVRSTLAFLSKSSSFLETAVMPVFPAAVQVSRTNALGEFRFAEWEKESSTRYVEARGADGKTYVGEFVQRGVRELNLELKSIELGDSELAIEFPGRFQGLPVELHLNGKPFDPSMLAPDDELVIRDLLAGRWRLAVSWHGIEVLPEQELRIEGYTRRRADLIPECIEGQDRELWLRAGREYPLALE